MIGKTFRLPESSPSYVSLKFTIEKIKWLPERRGRPSINLIVFIKRDLQEKGYDIENGFEDIKKLTVNAKD